jgi:hypothetical protein
MEGAGKKTFSVNSGDGDGSVMFSRLAERGVTTAAARTILSVCAVTGFSAA